MADQNPGDLLAIDTERLDQQWAEQPRLAFAWNDKLGEAKYALKRAEDKLELVEAQARLGVYQTPSDFGLEAAPKNKDIADAAVTASQPYQEAAKAVRAAFREVEHLKAMCVGVEHRKHGLGDEVMLFLRDYHSEPRVRAAGNEVAEAARKYVRDGAERTATKPFRRKKP
jgi:hypothetical protein